MVSILTLVGFGGNFMAGKKLRQGEQLVPVQTRFHVPVGRLTFLLPQDLIERFKNCSYWDRVKMSRLAQIALSAEIEKREKANGGVPFKKRPE